MRFFLTNLYLSGYFLKNVVMKKKVLLTTIVSHREYRIPVIQLSLYYLKAYFLRYSHFLKTTEVEIRVFYEGDSQEKIFEAIINTKPQVIGFSCYVWNILKVLKIAQNLKREFPDLKIVFGGPDVSPRAGSLMKRHEYIDVTVIGEGEETFTALLHAWFSGETDISGIKGIAYREKGKVIFAGEKEQILNLDEIPSPYLEGVIDENIINNSIHYIPTETMRGCPYRCHFCYYHKGLNQVSFFTLERIEREIKYILEKEPRGLYLMDPTFNINQERAKKILRMIINYNRKSVLHVELIAELLDEEMMDLLKEAKTDFIEIGFQSANKKTLQLINRDYDPDAFIKNVRLLNKKNVPFEIQLIDGLPADNHESLKESINWLLSMRLSNIRIIPLRILPGTYLRTNARRMGIRYNNNAPYLTIESDTFSPGDLGKTTKLRRSLLVLYSKGLLRKTLYPLSECLGLSYTHILEEWSLWIEEKRLEALFFPGKTVDDKQIRKAMKGIIISKQINVASDFVKHLSSKYGKPDIAIEIAELVREDGEAYLQKRRV